MDFALLAAWIESTFCYNWRPRRLTNRLRHSFALAVDFTYRKASVTLPLFRGLDSSGESVYYILTDASDFAFAHALGINYAPKLRKAAGSPGAQTATIKDGLITFKGKVDFSPVYKVVPGSPDPFPPTVADPGAARCYNFGSPVLVFAEPAHTWHAILG